MSIAPVTFSQKWNVMISPETEANHRSKALYNHMATIATAVTFIALVVISSLIVPEIAPFLIMGIFFLATPGIELGRYFLLKARKAKSLEEQTQKVRTCYERLVANKVPNPEITALSLHWKEKALEAEKGYRILHQKALEKGEDPKASAFSIKKYRIEALDAEKTATTLKVQSLFLESLIGKQKIFEKLFLKHGEDLFNAFSDFSKWDSREVEVRAIDPKFTNKDFLLTFNNPIITPISYNEVYQEHLQENLKRRIYHALLLA